MRGEAKREREWGETVNELVSDHEIKEKSILSITTTYGQLVFSSFFFQSPSKRFDDYDKETDEAATAAATTNHCYWWWR